MSMVLEDRVAALEREVAELRKLTLETVGAPPADEWITTFGRAKDDLHYEEAIRLGGEWRARENANGEHAGS
jgi:hypothetical protein